MGIGDSLKIFRRYSYLLQQLVSRDFKVKYKRSVLGVLWSVLNPLFTMTILYFVFSAFFGMGKAGTGGVGTDYICYLLVGITLFNFFSEATSLSLGAVVGNFNLITKVYMPKYIFPLSKVLSSSLNLLFSLIAMYAIVIIRAIMGAIPPLSWVNIFMVYDLACLLVFTIGMGLLLSALTVFFRDMFYIYGVVTTAWMYLTPILYPVSQIAKIPQWFTPALLVVIKINPLYHFINYARTIILYGQIPTLGQHFFCLICALAVLVVGLMFFLSRQAKFIYYI